MINDRSPIRVKRSTFTLANAMRFKPIYDAAIRTKTPFLIPIEKYKMSLVTLRQRINDGLLYLCQYWPEEFSPDEKFKSEYVRTDYIMLRQGCRFSIVSQGVKVTFPFAAYVISDIKPTTPEEAKELIESCTGMAVKEVTVKDINKIIAHNQNLRDDNRMLEQEIRKQVHGAIESSAGVDSTAETNPYYSEVVDFFGDSTKLFFFKHDINPPLTVAQIDELRNYITSVEPRPEYEVTKTTIKIMKL